MIKLTDPSREIYIMCHFDSRTIDISEYGTKEKAIEAALRDDREGKRNPYREEVYDWIRCEELEGEFKEWTEEKITERVKHCIYLSIEEYTKEYILRHFSQQWIYELGLI